MIVLSSVNATNGERRNLRKRNHLRHEKLRNAHVNAADVIDGSYILRLKSGEKPKGRVRKLLKKLGVRAKDAYQQLPALVLDDVRENLLQKLLDSSDIVYVEPVSTQNGKV